MERCDGRHSDRQKNLVATDLPDRGGMEVLAGLKPTTREDPDVRKGPHVAGPSGDEHMAISRFNQHDHCKPQLQAGLLITARAPEGHWAQCRVQQRDRPASSGVAARPLYPVALARPGTRGGRRQRVTPAVGTPALAAYRSASGSPLLWNNCTSHRPLEPKHKTEDAEDDKRGARKHKRAVITNNPDLFDANDNAEEDAYVPKPAEASKAAVPGPAESRGPVTAWS